MLCPSVFPPCHGAVRSWSDPHWPVRSLWPEARPLLYHMEQEMLRQLQEVRRSVEFMERLHQRIFEQLDHAYSTGDFLPIGFHQLGDSGDFGLSLDTQGFGPEELWVTQVGRRLRVGGRTERKQDDSSRSQEFRQEFRLPDGVRPDTVTCSVSGGRLQIRAPREVAMHDGKERIVPISVVEPEGSDLSTEICPAQKSQT